MNKDLEIEIADALKMQGYDLVRLNLLSHNTQSQSTLQIMIDRFDNQAPTLDDCTKVSRLLSTMLDVVDPIANAYKLEVSTPGVERPLMRLEDFKRFIGYDALVETHILVGNTKKLRGTITLVEDQAVTLKPHDKVQTKAITDQTDDINDKRECNLSLNDNIEPICLLIDQIKTAKLSLTGKLADETGLNNKTSIKHPKYNRNKMRRHK